MKKDEKEILKKQDRALFKNEKPGKLSKTEKLKQSIKIRFALEQEPKVDMYYYRVYRKLRIVRYLCVLIAALFVMSVPMAYSDQITTENFKYLVKYVKLQLSQDSDAYTELHYDASTHMRYGVYGEDIVLCTETALVYYDKLGNESMRVSYGPYNNPQLLISDKYVMVYDRGGTEYTLYNSFKRVTRDNTDYPITMCALSDNGTYAVVTSNENYISEIQVYNANSKRIGRVQRDLYLSELFFLQDGSGFGYAGFTTDRDGAKHGEVCLYSMKSEKMLEVLGSQIPLACTYNDGTLRVLYADRVVWYDKEGSATEEYVYPGKVGAYGYSDGNLVLNLLPKTEKEKGNVQIVTSPSHITTYVNNHIVSYIQWHDGNFYLLGNENVTKISYNGDVSTVAVNEGLRKLLFLPDGSYMGCYADHTEIISFD